MGAISGRAAHLVIDLLEHGVDEGKLTLDDFCEHLNSADNKWYHHVELKILTVLRVKLLEITSKSNIFFIVFKAVFNGISVEIQ